MPADMQALKNRFLMLSHIGTGSLIVGIVSHSVAYPTPLGYLLVILR